MIIVKIVGGLTSQMHKYSLGKILSLKYNVPLKLDLSWFEDQAKNDTSWKYQLEEYFNIKEEIATKKEISFLKGSDYYITWARRIKHYLGCNIYKKSYINTSFLPVDEFFTLGNNIYLEGEWTGFKYFKGFENDIKEIFTIKSEIVSNSVQKQLENIKKNNSVFLHIRRGDYISNPEAAKFHSTCSLDYYSKAINNIQKKIENPIFYVFSDDITWAKENLQYQGVWNFIDGNKNYEDLLLMSNCQYAITANSGFSLWGSWLIENNKKIVIIPENWVKNEELNEKILSFLVDDNVIII